MLGTIIGAEMTLSTLLILMATDLILGIGTAFVFSFRSRHSKSFLFTLALLPLVVSMVILMVNGNIGAGVAVAGAFALVRFRSMPGTAKEISAIFTSMALGLCVGMGYIGAAALFFVVTAAFTLLFYALPFGQETSSGKIMKITIPENFDYNGLFDETFDRYHIKASLITIRTANMGTLIELTYEAEFPGDAIPKEFLDEIRTKNSNLNVLIGEPKEKETL